MPLLPIVSGATSLWTMAHILLLAAAGLLAGAMNAIAGGGSFISFPAMVAAGLSPVIANASSTIALFPGTVASIVAFRRDFGAPVGLSVRAMLPLSLLGGFAGAVLLLATPARLFDAVIPFLLLLATLTFAFGAKAGLLLRRMVRIDRPAQLVLQFVLAIYGGYFGGAVGLMMMATWSLLNATADLKAMAPVRVLMVGATNGAAVLWFVFAGAVRWPETLAMLGASIIGGYLGARLTRFLPGAAVRVFVTILTATVTVAFFARLM